MRLAGFASNVLRLIPLLALAACAGGPPHQESPPSQSRARASGHPDVAAPVSAIAGNDAGAPAAPEMPTAVVDGKTIEVSCNGQDDDRDGLVDVLLPMGPNACQTGKKGACGAGFAICDGGKRTCLAPPPMPEVRDGIDNDCNGVVDDVPDASVRPRATLLVPKYVWADAAPDIANVVTSLAQAGIPFDRPATGSDWASVATLDQYALAIIPGYLLGSVVQPAIREKLERFVEQGGVLVVFKPIAEGDNPDALTLTGLRAGTRHRDVEELRFESASTPATLFVDSAEERSLGINPKGEKAGLEVWTYEVDASSNTEVVGAAFRGGTNLGAAITRRRLGKGAVYAVGHDLASFGATRCYINCFEAAGDTMRLFFDGALREGSQGHVAVLATTPALASSVLVLTHDASTHESQFSGPWGEPGALQFAKIEKQRGVRATFHVMTDRRGGQSNPSTLRELCALGMCPLGIQGVAPVPHFGRMGDGMVRESEKAPWRCKETWATYGVPSLCGEVLLSSQLVQATTNRTPRTWRSPQLAYHPELMQILASVGIQFDSSFGIGDIPHNVPLDLATTGIQQRRFHRRPILEFPLTCDDGLDVVRGATRERIELEPATESRFRALWDYILLQNQKNRSFTTLRINPTRGDGMAAENVQAKALILGRFLERVAHSPGDVAVRSIPEVGDFWRARLDANLETRFENGAYVGTLTIGKTTSPGITIELGDAIKSFECVKCGDTKIAGKRVAILNALPPGTKAEFTAAIR